MSSTNNTFSTSPNPATSSSKTKKRAMGNKGKKSSAKKGRVAKNKGSPRPFSPNAKGKTATRRNCWGIIRQVSTENSLDNIELDRMKYYTENCQSLHQKNLDECSTEKKQGKLYCNAYRNSREHLMRNGSVSGSSTGASATSM